MSNDYNGPVENSLQFAAEKISKLLSADYYFSKKSIALLLLQDDQDMLKLVLIKDYDNFIYIDQVIKETKERFINPIMYQLAMQRQNEVNQIIKKVMKQSSEKISFKEKISRILMDPFTGLPILFIVLYLGLYKFVGVFGAGSVVNFLEGVVFRNYVEPFISNYVAIFVPHRIVQYMLVGEFGIVSLAFRYAIFLILPIVSFFFLFFSIIEDSGYLPRAAMLIDRTFKKIGLSGRAVIPMVLGFGCVTMATMVTRTLPTKRERVIATLLLSLAIPCSAQLGVIIALLGKNLNAMVIWAGVIILVFVLIGYLTSKILPGQRPSFYMEVPPLRFPNIKNIFTKTFVRVKWYLAEIFPLFIYAGVILSIAKLTTIFDHVIRFIQKPVSLIGLPPAAAKIFIFGFFRRDYGAAGLYDLSKQGLLSGVNLVVCSVLLTLFLPCFAQFMMTIKERGMKVAFAIFIFVLSFSYGVAFVVNFLLNKLGVKI